MGSQTIVVVDGACHAGKGGVDGAFHRAAKRLGLKTERHPAQNHPTQDFGPWPGCGPRRNAYMVSLGADMGIACHPGLKASKGTLDCVRKMLAAGIDVILHASDDDPGRLISTSDIPRKSA